MSELKRRELLSGGGLALLGTGLSSAANGSTAAATLASRQNALNSKVGPRRVPARTLPVPRAGLSERAQLAVSQPYGRLLKWDLAPEGPDGWRAFLRKAAIDGSAGVEALQRKLGVRMEERSLGGVRCYELTPVKVRNDRQGQLVVVAHGGGFVFGAGPSGTAEAAMMAAFGGYRTISVDYRMPPDHPFPAALDDMVAVWKSLLQSHDPGRIGVAGTSAGGGLLLSTMLKIRELGLRLPAAIAPSSPWSDLNEVGDRYRTNEWIDNVLVSYSGYLGRAARLYAGGADKANPLLSPVYGDFAGMPPAILTAGTRDLFLSNTVRVHRLLRRAGVTAEMHVYEALSHAQFLFDPDMDETREIHAEIAGFFDRHLV